MIKTIKHIISLCAVTCLLALSFIGCAQPTIPETKYTVTFDNGEHGSKPESIEVTENTILTKDELPKLTAEEDFTFGGWLDENDEQISDKYTVTKNVTLKAKWTENTYTVTFKNDKGNAPVPISNLKKGSFVTKPDELTTTDKFIFGGWYRESACTNAWDFDTDTVSSSITLYAQWRELIAGDIILNDDTYVSISSITEDQKSKAVAIVCGKNKDIILGLGLKQSETKLAWAKQNSKGDKTRFDKIVCTPTESDKAGTADTATFRGDKDGSNNWDEICKVDTEAASTATTNYPAFDWVNTYGKTYSLPEGYQNGWYMPSIYELSEYIYKNREVLNLALKKLGDTVATPLIISEKDAYWSSSHYGSGTYGSWELYFGDASLYSDNKFISNWVRSVRAF